MQHVIQSFFAMMSPNRNYNQESLILKRAVYYMNTYLSFVRYVNWHGIPETCFVGIIVVASANADYVLPAMWNALVTTLPMTRENIIPKLIGCTFDGASVNQGTKEGR